jgi:hypothetical protein
MGIYILLKIHVEDKNISFIGRLNTNTVLRSILRLGKKSELGDPHIVWSSSRKEANSRLQVYIWYMYVYIA